MTDATETTDRPRIGVGRALVLAVAAAVATSTSYLLQPELRTVARDLSTAVPVIAAIAGAAILGYLAGLFLLVPLADRIRSHRLVAAQLLALAAAIALSALAPNGAVLAVTLFAAGAFASTGAQLSSLAGRYAAEGTRAQTVGIVTAGISAGIVLGRLVGGALADAVGWRGMLLTIAGVCVLLAAVALLLLPRAPLRPTESYRATHVAVLRTVRTTPALTLRAVAGACWFLSFSLVWVGVALALAAPPTSLPGAVIALYALAGLLGVVVTPFAGRAADRIGDRRVIVAGLALAILATGAMAATLDVPVALVAELALFDAGLFAAQVSNQSAVLAIDPDRPALHNGAYMTIYFVGGTAGSLVGGVVVATFGWVGVCVAAIASILAAMAITALARH